jgi:hypothetical protein
MRDNFEIPPKGSIMPAVDGNLIKWFRYIFFLPWHPGPVVLSLPSEIGARDMLMYVHKVVPSTKRIQRPVYNIVNLSTGVKFAPRGEVLLLWLKFAPRGELGPQGDHCPLGGNVHPFIHPQGWTLPNVSKNGEANIGSSPVENNFTPRRHSSTLGANLTPWG